MRDSNWVVQAQCDRRKEVLELIPSSRLQEDLPPALIDGHVHWLNLSTKILEVRPFERLWEESSENWRIDCASGQYCMYRGRETLVDIRSPTWAMVSKCFESLNSVHEGMILDDEALQIQSRNLLITISPIDSASDLRLSVTLPRYALSFSVNEMEELESRDFKNMVYDENQCVGTLFGLENFLVLRPKTHLAGFLIPESLILRRVLIPNGFPEEEAGHVRIDIGYTAWLKSDEPLYHTYDVDTELGCLIGNGSLKSTRLLAYVHATTSCHWPDPLTGKTGTQAALCLLQSAGCRSIMKLKAFDGDDRWTPHRTPRDGKASFLASYRYGHINTAYEEIQSRYYWKRNTYHYTSSTVTQVEKQAAHRIAYLLASNAAGPTSLEGYNESKCLTTRILAAYELSTFPCWTYNFDECSILPRQIALDQLLCNRPAPELMPRNVLLCDSHNIASDDICPLDQLLSSLPVDSSSSFQREYLARLETSAQCARLESHTTHKVDENLIEMLRKHYVKCRVNYMDSLDIMKRSLGPTSDPRERAIDLFRQWPPITADVLLRYLASTSPIEIAPCWRKCLISLALLLLDLQRARRLLRFALDGLTEELSKELENEGYNGWNPEEYPDWLLIQVGCFYSGAHIY